MTTVPFPISYTLNATYGNFRKNNLLFVEEVIEADILDLLKEEAPVVAAVDTKWRLPTPGIDHARPRAESELFQIRKNGNQFLVPLRMYEKSDLSSWRTATTDYLPNLHVKRDFAVTPFEVPLPSGKYALGKTIGSKMAQSFDGVTGEYDTFKVRKIDDPTVRDRTISAVEQLTKRFAIIDNELWMTTRSEPVIRYHRQPSKTVTGANIFIDVAEVDGDHEHYGFFKLHRMDEALEFLKDAYPEFGITTHIRSIEVFEEDAFTYPDELERLRAIALETAPRLQPTASRELGAAIPDEMNLIRGIVTQDHVNEDNGDQVADALRKVATHLNGVHGIEPNMLQAVAQSWSMRPISSARTLGR